VTAARNAFRVLLVLWAGSLWSVALWVTPTLFYAQHDRHLAGMIAGRLFSIETYVGIAAAFAALLFAGRLKYGWLYLAAAILALNEWGLRGAMAAARTRGSFAGLTFGAWHGVSVGLYVLVCLGALLLIWNNDFR
jgi:hypothetical protein